MNHIISAPRIIPDGVADPCRVCYLVGIGGGQVH